MEYEPETQFLREFAPDLFNVCWDAKYSEDQSIRRPIYADLGAAHPINKSLTSFFRATGWRGLAIDANEAYRPEWNAAGYGDHFVRALLSDQPRARFACHENSFTSRISPSPETDHPERWGINYVEERQADRINDILAERGIGRINLLTIDLEGHEFAVLQTLDFEKHRPAFIISEYVTAGEGIDPRVCNFLVGRGYEVVHMTESNLIYRRK